MSDLTLRLAAAPLALLLSTTDARAADVVSLEKGFSVAFPSAARELPAPPRLGANIAGFRQWLAEAGKRAYVVAVTDWQSLGPEDDVILDILRDSTVSAQSGRLRAERYLAVAGRPGRALDVELADSTRLTTHLFVDRAAKRSFLLTAGVPKAEAAHASVAAFLDSFRFLTPVTLTLYKAPDGSFSVAVPGQVAEKSDTIAEGARLQVASMQEGRVFGILRVETKAALEGDPQKRLDGARDGALAGVKGAKLITESPATVGGRPARDIQIDAAGDQVLFCRSVIDAGRQRVYSLTLSSRRPRADPAAAAAFFDSLQLLEPQKK